MKVIILAGGLGTRISEYTKSIPKPMIKVNNLPILVHIMKHFARFGFKDFFIATGYKGKVIEKYFSKNTYKDWSINVIPTGKNVMTGGRLKRLQNKLKKEENFFLTYGDGLSNINLKKLLFFHIKHKKIATLSAVRPPARFGFIKLSKNRINYFKEKSSIDEGWINGGFMILNKKIFKYLKEQMSLHPIFNNNINEIASNDTNKQSNKLSEIQEYANDDGYYLSLITMENAQSYYQLNDLWGSNKFTLSERSESCFIGIAQLLRLFLQFGIVHCDCHGGNILIKIKDQDLIYQTVDMLNLDVKIIDYGRYINIYEELQKDKSKYISSPKTKEKLKIIFSEPPSLNLLENKLVKLHDEYVKVQDEPDSEEKEKIIDTIINVMKVYIFRILLTDLSYNVSNFNYYNIQCSFMFKALKLIDIKDQGTKDMKIVFYDTKASHTREKYLQILEKLYFLIHPFTSTDEFSNEKIESLKQEKKFTKIDNVKVENHSRDIVGLLRTDKYKDKPVISNNNVSPIVKKKSRFTLNNPFRKKKSNGGKKTRKK